jgi:hypothetical protein
MRFQHRKPRKAQLSLESLDRRDVPAVAFGGFGGLGGFGAPAAVGGFGTGLGGFGTGLGTNGFGLNGFGANGLNLNGFNTGLFNTGTLNTGFGLSPFGFNTTAGLGVSPFGFNTISGLGASPFGFNTVAGLGASPFGFGGLGAGATGAFSGLTGLNPSNLVGPGFPFNNTGLTTVNPFGTTLNTGLNAFGSPFNVSSPGPGRIRRRDRERLLIRATPGVVRQPRAPRPSRSDFLVSDRTAGPAQIHGTAPLSSSNCSILLSRRPTSRQIARIPRLAQTEHQVLARSTTIGYRGPTVTSIDVRSGGVHAP